MDELYVRTLLYADDRVILAPSACGLQEMVCTMNNSVKKRGMEICVGKIKVMLFERGESTTECNMIIEGEKVKQVKEFVCVGSLFTNDGKHNRDIERRVNGALFAIMNSKSVSRQVCLAVHNGVPIPTLMYSCESWVWQKKNDSRFNEVEIESLRNICGLFRKDICRNSDIRERCGLKKDVAIRVERGILR
ncbi:hypothetical protein EVAR_31218_1 [Eumeta japonica]|uniref:Reverse transcriptase domain-containing protein n=1 Tax=Eumeta variegata TaxID=151549 RepID=A0A4C1W2N3_EUMVA|nr:hypothetical protein EVAR_31218_1 [Eumeta japonica]